MKTILFKKILVATDFSEQSKNAVKTASFICQSQKATLILLHVVEDVVIFSQLEIRKSSLNYLPGMKDSAKKRLKRIANNISRKYGIKVNIIVTEDITIEISRVVQENNPDLIIIGTHGGSRFRRIFIGSTMYRVIKHSQIPVMTVPGQGDWTSFSRILFPIRPVRKALEKYNFIRPIIQRNNSSLFVFGLTTERSIDKMFNIFVLGDQIKEWLRHDQIKFEIVFDHCNNYAEKILAKSEKIKADLIVITATFDLTLAKFFIGPFAQQIINHAKVPVLCIRPN
jgi:nucleotide-binding universal stress UspA family protein